MRKRIFEIGFISISIITGTLLLACNRSPTNSSQNSNENGRLEGGSAQAGNSNADSANMATNSEDSKAETTPDKVDGKKTIERYIAGVAKVSDASEYKEARKILYGDLDGDGDEDAAVQFTIEGMGGGNNYGFYLAVFKNENGKLTAVTDEVIGGKLNRDVTLTKIEDGKIRFDTKDYDDDDGACCPSIEGKTTYILLNNKLKEVRK